MRIAVIGWGSLIWCPGSLQIGSRWHRDGPELPVEFARISGRERDRVTLVILPHVDPQPTFWALSAFSDLEPAIENLRIREGGPDQEHIHWLTRDEGGGGIDPEITRVVRNWLDGSDTLSAAVWTGLPSNWCQERHTDLTPGDVIAFLRELVREDRSRRAEEYIRNTPDCIRTPVRRQVERDLGWTPNALPAMLFEDPK